MQTNSDWLNRTANKSPGAPPWRFFICHETASPNPDSPSSTLNYNLSSSVGSSYDDLIGRDGVRYRYLDADHWVAWHAGKNTQVDVDGVRYSGGELNSFSIGIELDGRCDGTKATPEQLATMAELLNYYGDLYGIPRDSEHLIMHATAVAPIQPSYRSDARCTTIAELVSLCGAEPVPLESFDRRYRVKYNRSVVRTGPARGFPVVGYVDAGREFMADSIKFGEEIEGNDEWLHASSGAGFLTITAAERV